MGPVWDLDEVARWNETRRGPGRPSGRRLDGRFEISEEAPIGIGGFADVFRATDLETGEDVAVKVLREVDQHQGGDRFERELGLLQQLDHPNVMPVLANGADGAGQQYYVMPLALGSLHDALDEFSWVTAASSGDAEKRTWAEHLIGDVIREVAAGLAYIHSQNVLHRDLCPRNVLRTQAGAWAISDFGLAREAERRLALTGSSITLGHEFYRPPEQWRGFRDVAHPGDIFALGKVLQALVQGRDPSPYDPPVGSPFDPIITKAIQNEPEQRYRDVQEFLDDLTRVAAAPPLETWESEDALFDRLQITLQQPGDTDPQALAEFRSAVISRSESASRMLEASHTFAFLTERDLRWLQEQDRESFALLIRLWAAAVARAGCFYDFNFCDTLAAFGRRVTEVSDNPQVLAEVVGALTHMGFAHNRWHVQDTTRLLAQGITRRDEALAVLQVLRDADPEAVEWTFGDFVIRSLHPVLRDGLSPPTQAATSGSGFDSSEEPF